MPFIADFDSLYKPSVDPAAYEGRRRRCILSRHPEKTKGFTLVELTVVMALVSILFFFSIPRLQNEILTDPTQKTARWLLSNVRSLKERSYREKKDYTLYVDTDNNAFWMSERVVEEEGAEEKERDVSVGNSVMRDFKLPEGIRILNVEYPGTLEVPAGVAEIVFYAKGYSDMAFIHMEDEDNQRLSFLIEPFLTQVRFYEEYVGFED
jgi:prepilin-type N-terminal cleavage/methylation domain-containing protein